MKKYFILLFTYDFIYLFAEIDGKITNLKFAQGQEKLSNCVTFSYDKEDLHFLPEGDPFDVDKNSSFSDFLDFAGYHFDTEEAVEAIIAVIIKNNMIHGLGQKDEILVCLDNSYYEVNEREPKNGVVTVRENGKRIIEEHNVYFYETHPLIGTLIHLLRRTVGRNVLIGFPFITISVTDRKDHCCITYAPTYEKTVVDKIDSKSLLPSHLPEKLLRNVKNRILVSKLYSKPLPDKVIYQNRIIDIGKAKFASYIDEIIQSDSKLFSEQMEEGFGGPTYIFDFGMHPSIKETFVKSINKPIFIEKEHNIRFICFMLRNMIIQHTMLQNLQFKAYCSIHEKRLEEKQGVFRHGIDKYYELEFIREFCVLFKISNPLSNYETKELEKIAKKATNK